MTTSSWFRSLTRARTGPAEGTETAAEALAYLPPEAQDALASLHGAPSSVCQAVVQLLPLGSRIALEQGGLARQRDADGDHYRLVLTPAAYAVMEEAAAWADGFSADEATDELDELDQRVLAAQAAAHATTLVVANCGPRS